MDYFKKINELKNEKQQLIDKADALIAENKFGDELTQVQNDIKAKAAAIDQLTEQAAVSAAGAEQHQGEGEVKNEKKPVRMFNSLGEQLQAIKNAAKAPDRVDERLYKVHNAVMGGSSAVGEDGGFAIQEDFAGSILESAVTTGEILSRVDTYTCSANSNSVRWMTAKETDLSEGVFGGVKMFWAEEGETVSATKPQFREARLELEKMMGFAYATDELLQDVSFMTSLYGKAFTLASRRLLEDAIIHGDGEKKPLGIMNSGALVQVAKAADQGAGTIVTENILGMWQRSHFQNRSKMIWLAHPDCEMELQKLTFADKPIWMPEGGIAESPYQRVLGRPVIYDDNMSQLGAKGDIALVDLSQYLLLKKGTAKQDWSMHVEFLTDQMCFRMVLRCNGKPKVDAPIKLKNSSLTRSPFVTLAARG